MSRVAEIGCEIGCEIRQVLASMYINVQSQCTHEAANVSVSSPLFFLLSPHSGHCEFMAELNGPRYPLNNSVVNTLWLCQT